MNLKEKIRKEVFETKVLFKSVPFTAVVFFSLSVVMMNIMASKALVNTEHLALDGGILVAWMSFLSMDMITRRFGAKASIKISFFALFVAVVCMAVFSVLALFPGDWALNDYASGINWWIIGASATAFIVSCVVNSVLCEFIKNRFKRNPDGKLAYVVSSYGSTIVGQFVDNLVFALVFTLPASYIGLWGMVPMSFSALLFYAAMGAVVELVSQILFSPIGYRVSEKWRKENIGQDYLNLL